MDVAAEMAQICICCDYNGLIRTFEQCARASIAPVECLTVAAEDTFGNHAGWRLSILTHQPVIVIR